MKKQVKKVKPANKKAVCKVCGETRPLVQTIHPEIMVCAKCNTELRRELFRVAIAWHVHGTTASPVFGAYDVFKNLGFDVTEPEVLGVEQVNGFLRALKDRIERHAKEEVTPDKPTFSPKPTELPVSDAPNDVTTPITPPATTPPEAA